MNDARPANARLSLAAGLAAGANLVASGAALFWLRHGLPSGEDVEALRRGWIASHAAQWRFGWLAWHLAALALVALLAGLALLWRGEAPILGTLAVICAAVGLSADLGAQAIMIGVLPDASDTAFPGFERTADMLTGYLGNGMYTVAGISVTWMGRRRLPAGLVALAGAVWVCGLWLAAATAAESRDGQFASTAVLMPAFILWSALLARHFHKRSAS